MVSDMNSAKLYILRGNTLSGTAAVITNDDQSTTNLWHKRLGHMSEFWYGRIGQERTAKALQYE